MVEERERACDEEVLALTNEPLIYAEGILNVCKLYTESPLAFVSGVTGANLKRRIEWILANHRGQGLNRANKFLLAGAASFALAIPLMLGIGNVPAMQAQSPADTQQFDVASIKPNHSGSNAGSMRRTPGGTLIAENATLRALIARAYNLRVFQSTGGPPWLNSARCDIEAKGQLRPGKPWDDQISRMLQTLLADRFQLRTHWETKELPTYALVVARNGPKLEPSGKGPCFDPATGMLPPVPQPGQPLLRICGGFNRGHSRIYGNFRRFQREPNA